MTEPRDLDPRLREALRATDQDRHDADRIVDAILDGWRSANHAPKPYPAGTWGPSAAVSLIERHGHGWRE